MQESLIKNKNTIAFGEKDEMSEILRTFQGFPPV